MKLQSFVAAAIFSRTQQWATMAATPPNQAANAGSAVQGDPVFALRANATQPNAAAAATATMTNAPTAGNPTKWVSFDDNGTTRFFPVW